MDKLSPEVIFVIGIAAMVISQGIKAVAGRFNLKVDRFWISLVLLVVSLILGLVYFPVSWPVFPAASDPGQQMLLFLSWLGQMLPVVSSIVGFAMLIYNLLGQKVFEGLGILTPAPASAPILAAIPAEPIAYKSDLPPSPLVDDATPTAAPVPDVLDPVEPPASYRNSAGVMEPQQAQDTSDQRGE